MKILQIFLLFSNFLITKQQVCWDTYKNSQSYGGTPVGSVASLTSCQTICQSRPDCMAVEWLSSVPGDKCFLFKSSNPPEYQNRYGIDHHISSCSCSWMAYPAKQSYGGVLQSQATSLDACKDACYFAASCQAIEFSVPQNQCFLFSNDATPAYDATGITHYIFKCSSKSGMGTSTLAWGGSSCYWTSQSGIGTKSGKYLTNVTSLDDCKFVCVQTDNCKSGLDWNSNSQCWLSTSSDTYNSGDITHYTYNCGVVLSWSVTANTNSPGGKVQPTAQTVEECKAICIDSGFCVFGVDWDTTKPMGQQCWISSSFQTTYYNGVDHYTPVRGQGSTANPGYVSNCTWSSYENSNSPLGVPKVSITTLTECQKKCIDANCLGIDWDSQGLVKCWFSTINMVHVGAYPGVTHYNYSCPGVSSTPTASSLVTKLGPDCDYILYVNSESDGGRETIYPTNTECRNQCTVQVNCRAYEWRLVGSSQYKCFLYETNAPPKYNGSKIGSLYYVFKKCN